MKLPFSTKKEKREYFLALLLRDEKAYAVVFEEQQGRARVVGEHEVHFKDTLETASDDELLDVLDKAISSAESELPKDVQSQKMILGVKEEWVEGGKIKKEYLVKLKKICESLGLSPIGFLIITEAIAHLIQKEEGAPVSGILIDIGKKTVDVTLLRAGRIVESKSAPVTDSIAKTTDILLHHFTSYEVLPSRIFVTGSHKDTEHIAQEFISHAWSKSLPFLHVPQVIALPWGFDAKAVLNGAVTQMGFSLL